MWPGIIQCTKELKRTKREGQMNGFSGEGKLMEKASWMSLVLTTTPPRKPYFICYLTALCSSPTWRSSCMATSLGSPHPHQPATPAACPSSGCPPSLRHTSLASPITGDDAFLPRLPGCSLIPSPAHGGPSVCWTELKLASFTSNPCSDGRFE